MKIPTQLMNKDFRFIPIIKGTKKPAVKELWQTTNNFRYYDKEFKDGDAYGVVCGFGNLYVIDFDDEETQEKIMQQLPKTFAVKTGGKGLLHLYFISDTTPKGFRANNEKGKRIADIQGIGTYVIGATSKHAETRKEYEIANNIPIAKLDIEEVRKLFKQYETTETGGGVSSFGEYELVKCKYHKDNDPSMALYKDTGTFYCFGCGVYGFLEILEFNKTKSQKTKHGTFLHLEETDRARYRNLFGEIEQPKKEHQVSEDILAILKDEKIMFNYVKEFGETKKIAGEKETIRALLISGCSSLVENIRLHPHSLITGESTAGKSHVTKKVFDIFPEENKVHRTKLSPEVFTYWHNPRFEPEWSWDGKILYIEDPKNSFLNSDTFKIMMSEGAKSTITIKQMAVDIEIEGIPLIFLTTAEGNPKREIINRMNIIPIDESQEQTYRILEVEAEEDEAREFNPKLIEALKFLKRVRVKIPYAKDLVTCFPISNIKVRRDFKRFLSLIQGSAALHQYQREKEGEFILANNLDYEIARRIMKHIQSNELMIALDHKHKKAYDTCIELTKEKELKVIAIKDGNTILDEDAHNELRLNWGFKVSEAHAKHPFVSEKHWHKLINDLASEGLLVPKVCEAKLKHKAPILYRAKKSGSLELPAFEKINGKRGNIGNVSNKGN